MDNSVVITGGMQGDTRGINDNGKNIIQKIIMILLIHLRIAIINKTSNNKCWRGCVEKGTLIHYWRKCE